MAVNTSISIDRCDVASQNAFVYSIYDPGSGAVYIGQTRSRWGALGRLSQHLSCDWTCNTFRQRHSEIFKRDSVKFSNIKFLAVPLSPKKCFLLDSSDYRESVETLVQDLVIKHAVENGLRVVVVSRVRASGYEKDQNVIIEAKRVASDMIVWLQDVVKRF